MKTNRIICGDCLDVMKTIEPESIDLIYMDPPFSSNQDYTDIWKQTGEEIGFEDTWEAGVKGYIKYMRPRIKECYYLLKPTGSIYVHCDWHAVHYINIMMDDKNMFGYNNFQNEIIWHYGARATQRNTGFPKKHDTILVYNKSNKYTYNPILKPYKDQDFKRYNKEDEKGRYALIKRRRTNGEIYYGKCYIKEGVPMTDVWDIPTMSSTSSERLGYPTQKPEALLEHIIKSSSNEGDIVLDPFCGCGTTVAVSARLNRRFIGIDISRLSIKVMENRLKKLRKDTSIPLFEFETIMPNTLEAIKKYDWRNFQDWVCEKLGAYKGKRGKDKGVDGITFHEHTVIPDLVRKKKVIVPEGTIIQTKHFEKGTIGEPHLKKFESTLRHHKKDVGIMVGWNFAKTALIYSLEAEELGIAIYLLDARELYKMETLEGPYKDKYKVERVPRLSEHF